ncbi:MAG: autotransporter-associated beta strand repeat-containing protein [Desulfobulbus sp.]|nr:autotransporter-associated beta strand repeat-containing protein [Desulfobulbus sp.]
MSLFAKKNMLPAPCRLDDSPLLPLFSGLFLGIVLFLPKAAIGETLNYNNGPSSLLRDPVFYYPGSNSAANYTPQVGALFPTSGSSNNVVNFIDGNIYVANPGSGRTGPGGDVFGGIGDTSPVTRNTVYIYDGRVSNVYGGLAAGSGVNLRDNTVFIEGGTVMNGVYGGRVILGSNVWAERNAVRVDSGEIRGNVYGAYSVVSGTFLQLNNIAINGGYIQGTDAIVSGAYGFVSGIDVRANSVTISGGTIKDANIYGGRGQSALTNTSTIESNTVTISGGLVNENFTGKGVYGGQNITGNGAVVRNNRVTISGGTVNANIYGGYNAGNGPTSGNIVNISGGSIAGDVYGGYSRSNGAVFDNTVTIKDVAIAGDIYGGYSASGSVTNNTVTYGVTNAADTITYGGAILGASSLTKIGDGTLILTGDNAYTGPMTFVSGGMLQIGDGGTTGSILGNITTSSGATIAFNRSDDISYGGIISGFGSLAQDGMGILTLSGANTYSGDTMVSAGTLKITGALGADNGNNYAGAISNEGSLIFDQSVDQKLSGVISGTGSLTKDGTGTLTLLNANAFTGGTEIWSGTLSIDHAGAIGQAQDPTPGSKAGYLTFMGSDTARVTVDSDMLLANPTNLTYLTNSFRTQGAGNFFVDFNAPTETDIAYVNIADPGGAFYVAPNTTMNVNASNNLGLGFNNAAGQWNDLYVEDHGTFNMNLAKEAIVLFGSGIDGDGALKISGLGAVELTNMIIPYSLTFQMGTTEVSGTNPGDMAFLWLMSNPAGPRVTFNNTDMFSLTGNDSSPVSAVLEGDGIVKVTTGAINVTNGTLMPIAILSDGTPGPGTLTLDAHEIKLTDFNLLYTAYGPQASLSNDSEGIPISNNALLNLKSDSSVDMGNGAVYFVTAYGKQFSPGDYLLIHSNQNFDASVPEKLSVYVDGFDLSKINESARGGTFDFQLGGDPGTTGEYTNTGTNNVWFTQNLNSLSMEWTGGTQDHNNTWEDGDRFDSLQGGGNEHQFLTGDKVYISGSDEKFTINLPAITRTSQIVVSGLVVGQDVNGKTDANGGEYTFTGEGGILADENSAFGQYTLLPSSNPNFLGATGMLQKYGNSTLIFENTGGNLFAQGIELWDGAVVFNQANQLGVDTGKITFKGDATLQSDADVTLLPSQKIVIADGVTGAFDTNGYTFRINGTISGDDFGDGNLNKTGKGTLILGGSLDSYNGAPATYAGNINIEAGTLVFDQHEYDTDNEPTGSINQILSGIISGSGDMTKDGSGVLTLTNANTFTGTLNIAAGKLALGPDASLATGTMRLGEDATFDYSEASTAYKFKNLYVDGQNATINTNGGSAMFSGFGSTITFTLPNAMGTSDTGAYMLLVENGADIRDSLVKVNNLAGGAPDLKIDQKITLIKTEDGLISNHDGVYVGAEGIATAYYLITDELNLYLGARANEQVKAISEGRLAGLAFLNQADLIWGPGMYAAMLETERKEGMLVPFAATSVGSLSYDTGSDIDVDGIHILTGLAWRAPTTAKSSLVTAAFFEAGWGSYDSHNSFNAAPAVRGDGNASYYGFGVLGRYEVPVGPGGMYGEASIRTGYADTDFDSRDILNGGGDRTYYDSGAMYFGFHAGVGYAWNISGKSSLDLSTKYIWLHLNDDSVAISGDRIQFQSADSLRWRTGGRYSYAMDEYFTYYGGAYFDYEFDGKAEATINGDRIDAPDLGGGTGIGELGLIFKPSPNLPLSLDAGVQGNVGAREGVTGTLRLTYEF